MCHLGISVCGEQKASGASGVRVTGNCELPDMDAGNQSPAFWNSKSVLKHCAISLFLHGSFDIKETEETEC